MYFSYLTLSVRVRVILMTIIDDNRELYFARATLNNRIFINISEIALKIRLYQYSWSKKFNLKKKDKRNSKSGRNVSCYLVEKLSRTHCCKQQ